MTTVRTILFGCLAMMVAAPAVSDCRSNIPASTPDSRFADNGDGTVTDTLTSLTWKRCPEAYTFIPADPIEPTSDQCQPPALSGAGFFSWTEALQYVDAANTNGGFAGQTDWRVPNVKELGSLVERRCFAPAMNVTVFPDAPGDWFWTASPVDDVEAGPGVLLVDFYYGETIFNGMSWGFEVPPYLRLVRGGPQ